MLPIPRTINENVFMNECKDFTWAAGIRIQERDLLRWKRLLRPAVYKAVRQEVLRLTDQMRSATSDGYDVPRGQDITNIVLNLK